MQESLIEHKGITCDWCGAPSVDHIYHQVTIKLLTMNGQEYDVYLCTKCYKAGKANEFK